jgi:hypothetical protein
MTTVIRCCKCKRAQTIHAKNKSGGVTVKEAESFGRGQTENSWLCPFCAGKVRGSCQALA